MDNSDHTPISDITAGVTTGVTSLTGGVGRTWRDITEGGVVSHNFQAELMKTKETKVKKQTL